MQKSQYDDISEQYEENEAGKILREFVFIPTIKRMIGDIRGKRILDLACGAGLFSRLFMQMGALEVVGVDISKEMIRLAKNNELKNPLGIRYIVSDVCELGKLSDFDIVFAGFCLHYAPNIIDLKKMCDVIAKNLEPDGRLIAFNENPKQPTHDGIQYHVDAKLKEDGKIIRTHYDNKMSPIFSFEHFHYETADYDDALINAGFCDIKWCPYIVDNNAPTEHNWDIIRQDHFSISVLTSTRNEKNKHWGNDVYA